MPKIAFLDFEASGLADDSFPIEVGWCFFGGRSGSFLIRPSSEWNDDQWDPLAEEVHHITREMLERDGRPARDVAEFLNKLFRTTDLVLSDAHLQDSFWLRRLFDQSPEEPNFELGDETTYRRRLFGAESLGLGQGDVREHRAEADARALAAAWQEAIEGKDKEI